MLMELSKVEQRYDAVLAVIRDGLPISEAAIASGVSRLTLFGGCGAWRHDPKCPHGPGAGLCRAPIRRPVAVGSRYSGIRHWIVPHFGSGTDRDGQTARSRLPTLNTRVFAIAPATGQRSPRWRFCSS